MINIENARKHIKRLLKSIQPEFIANIRSDYFKRRKHNKISSFYGLSPEEIFTKTYSDKFLGGREFDFYSGAGSHNSSIVAPYVSAVNATIQKFEPPPVIIDLGCGDFYVGNKIFQHSNFYFACDIVKDLIDRNIRKFDCDKIEFMNLNIISDELPDGDVAIIRQVLQHLDNSQISLIVDKLYKYKYIIVTEQLPIYRGFIPNKDKRAGPNVRLGADSGVVLTERPFFLKVKSSKVLCVSDLGDSVVETLLYELPRH